MIVAYTVLTFVSHHLLRPEARLEAADLASTRSNGGTNPPCFIRAAEVFNIRRYPSGAPSAAVRAARSGFAFSVRSWYFLPHSASGVSARSSSAPSGVTEYSTRGGTW
jgi:hypothetical protein